jgi:hypothetical protein
MTAAMRPTIRARVSEEIAHQLETARDQRFGTSRLRAVYRGRARASHRHHAPPPPQVARAAGDTNTAPNRRGIEGDWHLPSAPPA